jgi:predicted HD phosphohydrolase
MAKGYATEKTHYRRMDEGTDEDFAVLPHVHEQTLRVLPDRLFTMLRELSQDTAYNITRYDHCLQTATRALRDNKDDEYVAVALLHDVCEPLGPSNHGEVAAAFLRPFISHDNYWMLVQHGLFQTYFYARHMGIDPDARDIYKSDPAYEQTVEFCAKYDEVLRPRLQERTAIDFRADGPPATSETLGCPVPDAAGLTGGAAQCRLLPRGYSRV